MYAVILSLISIALSWFYLTSRRRHSQRRQDLEQEVLQRTAELGDRNAQLETVNTKLLETSYTDSLTGLYNRRFLDQFIEKEIERVERANFDNRNSKNADYAGYHQDVLFFMMIDLDGFKSINDDHGHNAGDRALLQVRDQLSDCMRNMDTVVRWGGDEFLVIGHTHGLSGIANLAERVCLAVSEHTYELGDKQTAHLSCSVGAVPYPFVPLKDDMLTWEQSLNIADSCAYLVKANGRNGWLVLSGVEKLSQAEAGTLPSALAGLHAVKKVQIISSLEEPLDLRGIQKSVA
jgi:diguanylate cyclase (GGDEF)-like protein